MYTITKRDPVRFRLAFIDDDFSSSQGKSWRCVVSHLVGNDSF